ncbi:MAG: hypothetical protein AB7F39_11410 [Variibacter sp.]
MRQVLPFSFSVHRQEGSRHVTRVYRDEIELPIREADEREAPLALRWRGGIVTGPKPAGGVPVRVYGGDGRAYEPVRRAVTGNGANANENVRLTRGGELDLSGTFLDRDELIAELKNPKAAKTRIPARPSAAIQDEQRQSSAVVQAFARDNLLILADELWVATTLPVFIVTSRDALGRVDLILPHRHRGSFFNVFGVLERDHALRAAEEMVTQLRSKGTKPEPRVHDAATQIEVINPTLCGLAVERSCRRDLMWRFREASAAFLPYGDADHARAYDKLRNRIEAFSRSRSDDDGLVEEDVSVTRACFDAYEACGGKRADEFRWRVERMEELSGMRNEPLPLLPGF